MSELNRRQRFAGCVVFLLVVTGCSSESTGGDPGAPVNQGADGVDSDAAVAADGAAQDTGGATAQDIGGATTQDIGGTTTQDTGGATAQDIGATTDAGASGADAGTSGDAGAPCVKTDPATEICDGVDNDCDGKIDNAANNKGVPICEDGDKCNGAEACVNGKCAAGLKLNCQAKACQTATCEKLKGCTYTAASGACEDGDKCTGTKLKADACAAGKCVGGDKLKCDDGNVCTADNCAKTKGCVTANLTSKCDDDNPCTTGEVCAAGTCGGSKPKCDDGNPCTQDVCDAKTGGCKNTATPGCQSCKSKAQCDDKNKCTTDACTANKCTHTKVGQPCVGPIDFQPIKLTFAKSYYTIPGKVTATLTVKNEGALTSGPTWTLWLSADKVWDSKDTQVKHTGTSQSIYKWPKGANVGVKPPFSSKPEGTSPPHGFSFLSASDVPAGSKFVCVRISQQGDKNKTNDTLCVDMPKLAVAEYKLTKVSYNSPLLPLKPVFAAVSYALQSGPNLGKPIDIAFYGSVDDKWDGKDKLYGETTLLKLDATGKATKTIKFSLPHTADNAHKFMCAVINHKALSTETTGKDNVLCAKVKIQSWPDIRVTSTQLSFVTKAGAAVGNPTWGVDYGCRAAVMSNAGFVKSSPFAVRCWISTTGKGPSGAPWSIQWQQKKTVPAAAVVKGKTVAGVTKNIASTATMKLDPAQFGVQYLCMDLNHDKKVDMLASAPVCRKITVVGPDIANHPDMNRLNTTGGIGPQQSSLARGKALFLKFGACNWGTVVFTGAKTKLKGRVLVSSDKTPSADDYVLTSGSCWVDKIHPTKKGSNLGCQWMDGTGKSFTIPKTVSAGDKWLIFQHNYDNSALEPPVNNIMAVKVKLL